MSEHVTEWLSIYMDGELRGSQLHHVEEHLVVCQACRAELETLQNLSALVREVPLPEFTASEKFTAQVSLRLPRDLPKAAKSKAWEVGWWMVPVSLLTLWIFTSTIVLVGNVVSTANQFGILNNDLPWMAAGSSSGAYWSAALAEIGLLSGTTLEWAALTEGLTRSALPQITWQGSIALLYLAWIVIWWARHAPHEQGQLLEG